MTRAFIVHWNRPAECSATVAALLAQDEPLAVTVIDNASEPRLLRELRARLPGDVEVIELRANLGWGAAFNRALAGWVCGNERYCVLSAHDALPAPGCIRLLREAMESHAELGIICPEYGDDATLRYSGLRGVYPSTATRGPAGALEYMPTPHSTLVMCRRACLADVGLFDERFFAYGDEMEIGLRATRGRWRCAMVWGAEVRNPGSFTPRAVVSYLVARNSLFIVEAYSGRAWAWLRAMLKLATGVRGQHGWRHAHVWMAGVRGVLDYLRGRDGPPPAGVR